METYIHHENLNSSLLDTHDRALKKEVLPNEINGLSTFFHSVIQGQSTEIEPPRHAASALLFTSGKGLIDTPTGSLGINEITLFVPERSAPIRVSASGGSLEFLELAVPFSATDEKEWLARADNFPYYASYSECRTYREKIKSEKTVSRTLMPENLFPRFCMGSVETTGPDRVASHKHPMLEQLFFGLRDNDVVVRADGRHLDFTENMLLHIPLGSDHGVDVEAGRKLHYIWIDLFRDKEGMNWITQEHIQDDK